MAFVNLSMLPEEFFGKVKNKAGDMEKILKEKDKHGLIKFTCFPSNLYHRVFRAPMQIILLLVLL